MGERLHSVFIVPSLQRLSKGSGAHCIYVLQAVTLGSTVSVQGLGFRFRFNPKPYVLQAGTLGSTVSMQGAARCHLKP